MAVSGVGAGAEILDKGGTGPENKQFRLRNTDFADLAVLWSKLADFKFFSADMKLSGLRL